MERSSTEKPNSLKLVAERARELLPEKFRWPARHHITWENQQYSLAGKGTKKEFNDWFDQYKLVAPKCSTCERMIFPGEPVGRNGPILMHDSWNCSPTGTLFIGWIDQQGQIKAAFEDGESLAEKAIRTGRVQVFNRKTPGSK